LRSNSLSWAKSPRESIDPSSSTQSQVLQQDFTTPSTSRLTSTTSIPVSQLPNRKPHNRDLTKSGQKSRVLHHTTLKPLRPARAICRVETDARVSAPHQCIKECETTEPQTLRKEKYVAHPDSKLCAFVTCVSRVGRNVKLRMCGDWGGRMRPRRPRRYTAAVAQLRTRRTTRLDAYVRACQVVTFAIRVRGRLVMQGRMLLVLATLQ
jgi:hypothetical protein